jgi:single-strand DNA-binding protein
MEEEMSDSICLTGNVANAPQGRQTTNGTPMATFRLACNQGYFDRKTQKWVDTGTHWFDVEAYNQLAANILGSLKTGDPVIVQGSLKVREWTTEKSSGTSLDVRAELIGHNLARGVSSFTKNARPADQSGQGVQDAGAVAPSAEQAGDVEGSTDAWASALIGADAGGGSDETPF